MTSFQYIFFSDVKVLRCLKHTTWQKRILLLCKESLWSQGLFPATHLTGFRRTPLWISLQRECDNRSSLSYHGPDAFLRLGIFADVFEPWYFRIESYGWPGLVSLSTVGLTAFHWVTRETRTQACYSETQESHPVSAIWWITDPFEFKSRIIVTLLREVV